MYYPRIILVLSCPKIKHTRFHDVNLLYTHWRCPSLPKTVATQIHGMTSEFVSAYAIDVHSGVLFSLDFYLTHKLSLAEVSTTRP